MLQAPVLLQILQKMRDDKHPFYPQVSVLSLNCCNLQLAATLKPLLLLFSESFLLWSYKVTDGGWKWYTSPTR